MWAAGVYNRDALNALATEVDKQKNTLLRAWKRKSTMFATLGKLDKTLMESKKKDASKNKIKTRFMQVVSKRLRR